MQNSGFTVATTDIETGDAVIFDTGKGDRIGIDHILASCGFLPEFAPVERWPALAAFHETVTSRQHDCQNSVAGCARFTES